MGAESRKSENNRNVQKIRDVADLLEAQEELTEKQISDIAIIKGLANDIENEGDIPNDLFSMYDLMKEVDRLIESVMQAKDNIRSFISRAENLREKINLGYRRTQARNMLGRVTKSGVIGPDSTVKY